MALWYRCLCVPSSWWYCWNSLKEAVCLFSIRKKSVSRNWTHGINFCYVVFLIGSGQLNFYAENIPLCLQSLAVLHPSSSLVIHRQDSKCLSRPSAFRQDLNNHTNVPSPINYHFLTTSTEGESPMMENTNLNHIYNKIWYFKIHLKCTLKKSSALT